MEIILQYNNAYNPFFSRGFMEKIYIQRIAKIQSELKQKGMLRSKNEIFEMMVELLKKDLVKKINKKDKFVK